MSEKVIVALDAMGGDNAPVEIVKGAVEAVKEEAGLLVKLVGREEQVRAELAKYTYPQGQIEVVDAPDVIETGEQPVMAIRRKKDSSMGQQLPCTEHLLPRIHNFHKPSIFQCQV